jgi:hypothetical protein
VLAEQAIFTSLMRRGKAGYHLVSRSPGVTESEALSLATLSPSHAGMIADLANKASVNFHPMPSGRFALARTREGGAEYSGRGGRQLYTHAVIFEVAKLKEVGYQPFAIYRDALALGHFHYRANPPSILKPLPLSSVYPPQMCNPSWLIRELGQHELESVLGQLDAGHGVVLPFAGDRAALAEALIDRLSPQTVLNLSFATSLHPSAVRPYQLTLVAPG